MQRGVIGRRGRVCVPVSFNPGRLPQRQDAPSTSDRGSDTQIRTHKEGNVDEESHQFWRSWPGSRQRTRGDGGRQTDRSRRHGARQAQQAVNCKSTLKIAIVTPFTGGAGFLGNAQLSWAKYAVKRLAPAIGPEGAAGDRRHARRAGPGAGPGAGAEVRGRPERRRDDRPVHVGCGRGIEHRPTSTGMAHISPSATRTSLTKGSHQGSDAGVLPRRSGRRHPGPERREVHGRQAERQEGRPDRLPGAVLAWASPTRSRPYLKARASDRSTCRRRTR